MKNINWFFITIIMTGIFLYVALRPSFHKELSFYGFAESRATEINYNYAVVVDKILVTPGQEVKSGQVLNAEDMRGLIRKLERCPEPLLSPSGQSTLIHMSAEALQREFGRKAP